MQQAHAADAPEAQTQEAQVNMRLEVREHPQRERVQTRDLLELRPRSYHGKVQAPHVAVASVGGRKYLCELMGDGGALRPRASRRGVGDGGPLRSSDRHGPEATARERIGVARDRETRGEHARVGEGVAQARSVHEILGAALGVPPIQAHGVALQRRAHLVEEPTPTQR